ncbi:MAG: hypothetical protein PHI59_04460 [Candidatus Omnitrophica bacterium]|nr:hypothetical protein [Candidatus Omnitrophota bacterium]
MKKLLPIIIILSTFLYGCGDGEKVSKPPEPGIVDVLTGREQISAYQRTKEKIQDINKTSKERNEGL